MPGISTQHFATHLNTLKIEKVGGYHENHSFVFLLSILHPLVFCHIPITPK